MPLHPSPMSLTLSETQRLQTYFQPAIGEAAWNVALGMGSFLTLEFGAAGLESSAASGTVHGTYHFWVYCCAWRIETLDDVLAYSEDDRSRLEKVVGVLEGEILEQVEIHFPSGDTVLHFSGRLILRLMPIHAERHEHWLFYMPEGTLVFGPGRDWQFEGVGG
jgi:hypothetical protein